MRKISPLSKMVGVLQHDLPSLFIVACTQTFIDPKARIIYSIVNFFILEISKEFGIVLTSHADLHRASSPVPPHKHFLNIQVYYIAATCVSRQALGEEGVTKPG